MGTPTRGRRRPAPLRAMVQRTELLTPRLVRVTVTGPEFDRYRWAGPAAHFKLMLPEAGELDVELPVPDENGTVDFSAGRVPTMRTYTARHYNPDARLLDIDLVLHGDGPAALWAQHARPGDRLAISVPRAAGFVEDPSADWVLLAGDASALPAIATIVPMLTKPTTVIMDVEAPADRIDLGRPVQWVDTLAGAVSAAVAGAVPSGRGQIWVAAEAAVIRRIRTELLTTLDRDQVTTRGYWRAGERNHPDHDYGDDA